MSENNEKVLEDLKSFSKSLRKAILDTALEGGSSSSHFGGALSIVEIVSILFHYKMKINLKDIADTHNNDQFILSKGHACLAYYAALNKIGKISNEEMKTFEKDNSNLAGHPVKNQKIGIDFSNGSLGMGLSIGIGISIANKRKKNNLKTFVILGDGECNEGSVWEAAMSAPKFELDNLIAIVDKNNFQQTGSNQEIMDLKNLKEKWSSFGWDAAECDGHNFQELKNYFDNIEANQKPKILIANTIKGKGFSFAENNNDWHHSIMTKTIYEKASEEIE